MQARSHMVVLVAVLTSVALPRHVVSESEGSPAEGDDDGSDAGTAFPLETTNSSDGDLLDSSRPEEANTSILQDDRYIYEVVGPSVAEMTVRTQTIPTVLVDGVLHYDIAQATTTRLILGKGDKDVKGVTSTSHEPCLVRDLVIEERYILHKNISNCRLQSLSIKGGEWWCMKKLVWLREAAEEVNTEDVVCENIWCHGKRKKSYYHYYKCPFLEGLGIVHQFDQECPDVCQTCKWYYNQSIIERVIVHCENVSLTDSSLPEFPLNTTDLRLDFNKLRSTKMLFESTKNQKKLQLLSLIGNEIDTFPVLPASFFPKLGHVYLQRNKIQKMDMKGLQLLLDRKNFTIELRDNPWTCDCKLYHLNKLVLQHYGKDSEVDNIEDLHHITCFSEINNDTIPLRFLSGEDCQETSFALSVENYWTLLNVVLGLLNILMFYFVVDLVLILVNFQGTRSSQRPKVDLVVCGMKRFYSHVYRRLDGKELQKQEEEEEEEYRNLRYRNCYRESFSVRRRTPRPGMEYDMG